uniref:LisH domain-containing protein n=1 Tax=Oryza punctata TaxID=4537 RepID=A0A0E0KG32_ORYPU
MAGLNPGDLTANDLNAAVYRYLLESAFNFYHESHLDIHDIEGKKIPQGALIRVVLKGLEHIKFEANAEVADDENFHHFSALDLLTKDRKNDTIKTVEVHGSDYAEDTILRRKQPKRKAKDYSVQLTEVSSSDSDEISRAHKKQQLQKAKATEVPNTTAVHREQPVQRGRAEARARRRKRKRENQRM